MPESTKPGHQQQVVGRDRMHARGEQRRRRQPRQQHRVGVGERERLRIEDVGVEQRRADRRAAAGTPSRPATSTAVDRRSPAPSPCAAAAGTAGSPPRRTDPPPPRSAGPPAIDVVHRIGVGGGTTRAARRRQSSARLPRNGTRGASTRRSAASTSASRNGRPAARAETPRPRARVRKPPVRAMRSDRLARSRISQSSTSGTRARVRVTSGKCRGS